MTGYSSTMKLYFHAALVVLIGLFVSSVPVIAQDATRPSLKSTRAAQQKDRLQERTFLSESLGRKMTYRILLPKGYSTSPGSYPVLYLLHGWHGDYKNWSTLTDLIHYAEDLPIIIVMPDAGDSWYVDSATVAADKFERYLVKDLIGDVEANWRALRSSHRRAVAGLSMGGYGAVKIALKFPDVFTFAGSLGGAFNAVRTELADERADLAPSLVRAYGPADSTARAEDDVMHLVEHGTPVAVPYIFLTCGTHDIFLTVNRELAAKLNQRAIAYEYHEVPGAHVWGFWDARLPDLLHAASRAMSVHRVD